MAIALAVKTTNWLGVTAGGWNELREGGDDTARGWRDSPPRDGTAQREDREVVGALAADQDIEVPVGLGHHVDRSWAARESLPAASSSTPRSGRCLAGARISTTPSARATTTCPLGRACAASTCWPEKTTLAPAAGLSRSNRTRFPPAVTA